MKLQPELLPNFKTANEELTENKHTYAPFHIYCEGVEKEKQKRYMEEEFSLSECRLDIFGPDSKCPECQGTSWVPVSKMDMREPLRSLWVDAEIDVPSEDGYHLVPCPKCNPQQTGETGKPDLDEHITKIGNKFELKSKKTGKNLGKYPSKSGAKKREAEVEYFKHKSVKEENGVPKGISDGRPLPWRLHDEVISEMQPSDFNKTKSSAEKDEKKTSDAAKVKKDPNASEQQRKEKERQTRKEKEKERQTKKLLPYEFTDQKDAEKSAGHLGIKGSHGTGNGVYKPGSSDFSLRDAVYKKKGKQHMSGKLKEEKDSEKAFDKGDSAIQGDSHDAYGLDKANCHESDQNEDRNYMRPEDPKTDGNKLAETVRKIKELAGNFPKYDSFNSPFQIMRS